jgi:hypothetical protein
MPTWDEKERDLILAALRARKHLKPYAIELIAKRWKVDKKSDRKMADWKKFVRFSKQREELIAGGMSAAEANEQLYRAAGRASADAFDRWIRPSRRPFWRVRLLVDD